MSLDPKGVCNYCNTHVGRDKVKTCSRCRLVRYCSKECQVAAWRTHKQRCSSSYRDRVTKDPEANALHSALSKWVNVWRTDLHSWAIWAMDLANHPEDRLATHSVVIELVRRPNPPSPSHYFQMHSGDIMTRENFLSRLRVLDEPNDETVAAINKQHTSDTAQIILVCEDLIRILWFSLRDGGAKMRQGDPVASRMLSENWQQRLIVLIDTGNPSELEW